MGTYTVHVCQNHFLDYINTKHSDSKFLFNFPFNFQDQTVHGSTFVYFWMKTEENISIFLVPGSVGSEGNQKYNVFCIPLSGSENL